MVYHVWSVSAKPARSSMISRRSTLQPIEGRSAMESRSLVRLRLIAAAIATVALTGGVARAGRPTHGGRAQ